MDEPKEEMSESEEDDIEEEEPQTGEFVLKVKLCLSGLSEPTRIEETIVGSWDVEELTGSDNGLEMAFECGCEGMSDLTELIESLLNGDATEISSIKLEIESRFPRAACS